MGWGRDGTNSHCKFNNISFCHFDTNFRSIEVSVQTEKESKFNTFFICIMTSVVQTGSAHLILACFLPKMYLLLSNNTAQYKYF